MITYMCVKDFMPTGHHWHHNKILRGTICRTHPYCCLTRKGRIWLDAPYASFDVTKAELRSFFVKKGD